MTRERFIKILDRKRYSYEIEGDKIVVTCRGSVNLEIITSLPPGVVFKNEDDVFLNSLETLPHGVEFKNGGTAWLPSLKTIYPSVEFKNGGSVKLDLLMGKYVVWFENWPGNIEGVDSKKLLNLMIKQGVFI